MVMLVLGASGTVAELVREGSVGKLAEKLVMLVLGGTSETAAVLVRREIVGK